MTHVSWGAYRDFEGPWVAGTARYHIPSNPDELDRYLAVVSETEGGTYDAVNMYDTMICSVGLIQLGEKNQCSASALVGHIIDACGLHAVMGHLGAALECSGTTLRKKPDGTWRVILEASGDEVSSVALQKQVWLGCDGKKGSWTPESVKRASTWAKCMSDLLADKRTYAAQEQHVKHKLMKFVTKSAERALFSQETNSHIARATRAAYVSFAANLPAVASSQLDRAMRECQCAALSVDWCLYVLKTLTFGPAIGIYPTRYDKIRPVLESLYDVTLPRTHVELQAFTPSAIANASDIMLIPPETKAR